MSSMQGTVLQNLKFQRYFSANENYAHKHKNGAEYGEYNEDNGKNERQNGSAEGREDDAGEIQHIQLRQDSLFFQQFEKESMKFDMSEEMMNDAIESGIVSKIGKKFVRKCQLF